MTRSLTSRSFCVPKKGFATQHGDFLKKVADWVKHKKEEAKEAAAVQAELRGGLIPGPDKKRLLQGKMLLPQAQALGDARKNYLARRNSREIPEKSDVPSRPRPPGEEGGAPSALLKNRKGKGK